MRSCGHALGRACCVLGYVATIRTRACFGYRARLPSHAPHSIGKVGPFRDNHGQAARRFSAYWGAEFHRRASKGRHSMNPTRSHDTIRNRAAPIRRLALVMGAAARLAAPLLRRRQIAIPRGHLPPPAWTRDWRRRSAIASRTRRMYPQACCTTKVQQTRTNAISTRSSTSVAAAKGAPGKSAKRCAVTGDTEPDIHRSRAARCSGGLANSMK